MQKSARTFCDWVFVLSYSYSEDLEGNGMVKLVLIRHGQSIANKEDVYTGWSDSPLTKKGISQARHAGKLLLHEKISFSDVHTSVLVRAIKTANIVLDEIGQNYLPIHKTWRLNERHYGALRGLNKNRTREIYGEEQVALWRRSFYTVPPLLEQIDHDRRYDRFPDVVVPRGESLKMAYDRIVPYWTDEIALKLLNGENQLVVAHGSTLRAMIKFIEHISDQGIDGVEVANGTPIIYELDHRLKIVEKKIL